MPGLYHIECPDGYVHLAGVELDTDPSAGTNQPGQITLSARLAIPNTPIQIAAPK